MHVRVAPPRGGPRLNAARRHRSRRALPLLLVALNACWPAGACHRPAPADGLDYPSRVAAFHDLIALAFQCNQTRVLTFMIENGLFLGGTDPRRPGAKAVTP